MSAQTRKGRLLRCPDCGGAGCEIMSFTPKLYSGRQLYPVRCLDARCDRQWFTESRIVRKAVAEARTARARTPYRFVQEPPMTASEVVSAPDSLPAATTQGGETLPAKVTLYPQERTLNIPAAPLAVGVTAGCPVAAAAPVEEGREGETAHPTNRANGTTLPDLKAAGLSDVSVAYLAGAKDERQTHRAFGQHRTDTEIETGARAYTASRAPHEGPTSGLREKARLLIHAIDSAGRLFVEDTPVQELRASLAASPLAPTSDGALLDALERHEWSISTSEVDLNGEISATVWIVSDGIGGEWRSRSSLRDALTRAAASRPVVENAGETR